MKKKKLRDLRNIQLFLLRIRSSLDHSYLRPIQKNLCNGFKQTFKNFSLKKIVHIQ